MKIAVFENESWATATWRRLEDEHDLELTPDFLTPELAARHTDAEVVTIDLSPMDPALLATLKKLQLIAIRSTGYDNIDRKYCRERGIMVCNVPGYAANAVAEHVFALLLALSRRVLAGAAGVQRGEFSALAYQGFELRGKTMAVIGTGAIGRRVAQIAKGFGMKLIAFDVKADPVWATDSGVHYLPLEDALGEADIVTLHIPATPQTRQMLCDAQFEQMKPGVILINTARGELIDSAALLRALNSGRVAAAGLDVLPEEQAMRDPAGQLAALYDPAADLKTLLANHNLLKHPNVVVTPHCAYNTREAVQNLFDETLANIEAFVRGAPQNRVI